jgi:hypothetical protein
VGKPLVLVEVLSVLFFHLRMSGASILLTSLSLHALFACPSQYGRSFSICMEHASIRRQPSYVVGFCFRVVLGGFGFVSARSCSATFSSAPESKHKAVSHIQVASTAIAAMLP